MVNLIAVSGYAHTGKDEFARSLIERAGFTRVAFADKMREFLAALNPIIGYDHQAGFIRLADVIPPEGDPERYTSAGWAEAKEYAEVRDLLQRCGTEAGRKVLGADIWVDATMKSLQEDHPYVITDCRFPNEAASVVWHGGVVVRIDRPGIVPVNNHESETALDGYDFDVRILNDGSIADLHLAALETTVESTHRRLSSPPAWYR